MIKIYELNREIVIKICKGNMGIINRSVYVLLVRLYLR